MHISLPIRKNHMGIRWILPSSVVARFAIMVIERSLSISAEFRTAGLVGCHSSGIEEAHHIFYAIKKNALRRNVEVDMQLLSKGSGT